MKKKLDNLAEKIKKKMKKYINSDNVTWTREALLRLIYIKKGHMTKQKSVRGNSNKEWHIPIYGQKRSARIVTPKYSLGKFGQFNLTVNDSYPNSPKDIAASK